MKHIVIYLAFLSFGLPVLKAQKKADSVAIVKNAVYLEIVGTSSTIFSVHYDRIIKQMKSSYLNLDVGFGYFPPYDIFRNNIGIPVTINYTSRLYKRNHLEVGAGLTYSYGTFHQRNAKDEILPYEALFGNIRLGYKYQKPNKGLFFKAGFTPLFNIVRFSEMENTFATFLPFIGLAAGYSF